MLSISSGVVAWWRHNSRKSAHFFGLRLLSAVRDKLVSSSVDCIQVCVDVLLLSKEHH